MNKSEQAKASERVDGVDRVSNLPDPILHLILSGLPATEEIIRTSILSRRWRYLWTSIPRIDIDHSRRQNTVRTSEGIKFTEFVDRFTEFVDRVLLSSSLDLDSFRLSCETCFSMSRVGRWIHVAVTRNVKQLHLEFRPYDCKYEKIEMPHCLVTCCSLEVLTLFLLGGGLSLPKYTGFPSLRVLELNDVELLDDADTVKAFFTSCPLLEDLSIMECMIDKLEFLCISSLSLKNLRVDNRMMAECGYFPWCEDLQISCPKLVFLELYGPIACHFSVDSLNSLKKAVIQMKVLEFEPENYTDTACELFARISHVESLSISHSFVVQCFYSDLDMPVSLPNLNTLELTIDCIDMWQAFKFLNFLPDLKSLHLNFISDIFPGECLILEEFSMRRILTRQLKRVVFVGCCGEKWERELARFFLEHGKALEEMVFSWKEKAKFKKRSKKTMKKVSKFHKASPTVKLIALLKPWTEVTTFLVKRD